jgi:hypothetical protein
VQYLQPFLYFARKPETGYKNVLLGCLCPLIPFVGVMVLLGYRAQVSEELERDPEMKDHPDIKLDDLTIYLKRGVWPFLTRLLFMVIVVPVAYAFAFAVGFGIYQVAPEPLLGFAAGALVFLAILLVATTILWPMEYHAQVTQKFAPIEEFKFAIRFARVCWFSSFVAVLMYSMLGSVVTIIGMLLCYIGLYPAFVVQQMAEQHLMSQLYLLYLEEGGEPIRRPEMLDDDEEAPRAFRASEDA